MIPEDPDYCPMSGPALPAEIAPDAADPKRREFFKSLGERAKYVTPTLMVLTFSRRSLAAPPPPSGFNPSDGRAYRR
jgi:hypothetical protein